MRNFEIDGNNYTVALSWHTATGPGVKKDISSFISSEGFSFGTIYSKEASEGVERNAIDQLTGIKDGYVYQVGATDDDDATGTHSLAHALAELTTSSALFCLSLNEGEKWVLAVNDNKIVTTTDCALPDDEARGLLEDLFEALIGTHSEDTPFVCLFDDPEFMDIAHDHDQDFVELVSSHGQVFISGLLDGSLESANKNATIKNLEGKSGLKLILGAIILGGGYYGYTEYQDNQLAQERLRQQAQKVVQPKEPEGPSQEELLENARIEENKWLNDELLSVSNISLVESAITVFNDTPRLVRGWESRVLSSDGKGVQISWKSERGTTLVIDQFLKDRFDGHSFNARGDTVSSHLKVSASSRDSNKDAYRMIEEAPSRVWVLHQLSKRNGISWQMSKPETSSRPTPISGLNGQSIASERQLPYSAADLIISGRGISELRGLYSLIDEKNGINIEKIDIDFENKNWEIKGVYYEVK